MYLDFIVSALSKPQHQLNPGSPIDRHLLYATVLCCAVLCCAVPRRISSRRTRMSVGMTAR